MSKLSDDMPDESGIRGLLQEFRGAVAYEIPGTDIKGRSLGNHGDFLMHRVYREIAADCGIEFTSDVNKADILVVRPGGALIEHYSFPAILRQRLAQYPDIPLVIFPSTTLFQKTDPGLIFRGREAPTLMILREGYSYRQLELNWKDSLTASNVSIELDHDVVASGHARVPEILRDIAGKPPGQQEGVLVVARLDVEARPMSAGVPRVPLPKQLLISAYRKVPSWGRRRLRNTLVAGRQARENELLIHRFLRSRGRSLDDSLLIKSNSNDLSDPSRFTSSEYAQGLLGAECIITNRLHVALPSAALGTETYLIDTGYHKLRGVYQQSLSLCGNVSLISSDE